MCLEGDSYVCFGYNMVLVCYCVIDFILFIFSYLYECMCDVLDMLYCYGELDFWDGVKLCYVNFVIGGWLMLIIVIFMQFLFKGFVGKVYCSIDVIVYSVVEGCGMVCIGDM